MGVADSVPLDPAFQAIASWPWSKVQSALKAYADGDHEFCIDADTIANITCLSDATTDRLVALLSHKQSKLVNALTLLVSIILVGDAAQPNVDIRLEALFDLIDFSSVSSITMEESTILLILISSAMGSIVNKQESIPSDKVMERASVVIYEALDKAAPSIPLLKSEFILWATSILDELPTNKLDTIFTLVFVKGVGITGIPSGKKQGVEDEPDLPDYRKEEQENVDFKGDAVVEESDAVGKLIVKFVKLSKIRSSEVYVTLRLGDGSVWAQSTDISSCKGNDTEWNYDFEEMSGAVAESHLAKNVINFTVKDSNESSADKFVGKAKVSLEDLRHSNGKWFSLTGDLNRHDESDFAGEYMLKARYLVPSAERRASDMQEVAEEEEQEDEASVEGKE